MKLDYPPLSSYSQKVVIAFHEKGAAFEPRIVSSFQRVLKEAAPHLAAFAGRNK